MRNEEHVKREHYGDKVVKDENPSKKYNDGPKNKGDYKSGEQRPFERHSGTGKPAFSHEFKKGGHGKSNVGNENDVKAELDEKGEEEAKKTEGTQPAPVPEPKEEIVTLDEYVSKTGFNTEFLKKGEEVKIGNVHTTDPNVKMITPKEKDTVSYNKKNVKHTEEFVHAQVNNIQVEPQLSHQKSKTSGSKKTNKLEFNEENFPSLS